MSKIIALITALTLFLPARAEARTEAQGQTAATADSWTGVM